MIINLVEMKLKNFKKKLIYIFENKFNNKLILKKKNNFLHFLFY